MFALISSSQANLLGDIVIGAAVGAGCVFAAPVVLGAVGFTSAGVAAGSLAAGVQTATTVAGGAFATAQSIGAAGVAGSTVVGAMSAGAAANVIRRELED